MLPGKQALRPWCGGDSGRGFCLLIPARAGLSIENPHALTEIGIALGQEHTAAQHEKQGAVPAGGTLGHLLLYQDRVGQGHCTKLTLISLSPATAR